MTHINHINESAQPMAGGKTNTSRKDRSVSFEDELNKAFDKPRGTPMEAKTVSGLGEIESAGPEIISTSDIVTGKTYDLLTLLDAYSSKLDNPQVSLKSMASALEEINRNADNLIKEAGNLTRDDENLKKIATQTAVTAQTEYIKFQRGDYLS